MAKVGNRNSAVEGVAKPTRNIRTYQLNLPKKRRIFNRVWVLPATGIGLGPMYHYHIIIIVMMMIRKKKK